VTQPIAPTPPARAIAVLPLADLTGDPQTEYLADGLSIEIADRLAGIGSLHVASPASSGAFKSRRQDRAAIGRALGVGSLLDGSARRAGDRLQVNVQLITVGEDAPVWSERYDRPLGDLVALEEQITLEVARASGVTPTEEERRTIARPPTTDVRAYDRYLRGRHLTFELLKRRQESARDMFRQATALDPAFALAHAGLANCCSMLFQYWDSSTANQQAADAASAEAVGLAPELAETHTARGLALSLGKRYDEAEQELQVAIRLRPRSFEAHYFLARSCRARGQMAAAAQWFERACTLRPDDYAAPALLSSVYVSLGRPDDANATQRRALELAAQQLERNPDDTRALYLGAGALIVLGDSAKARQWVKRALAMDPDDSAVLYNVACVYAQLGLADSAIDCLEQAVANGFGHWEWVEHDSDLDSLRTHPRFMTLFTKR
jgi:TolB-like protein/Flp pilus assembly protein TadD